MYVAKLDTKSFVTKLREKTIVKQPNINENNIATFIFCCLVDNPTVILQNAIPQSKAVNVSL